MAVKARFETRVRFEVNEQHAANLASRPFLVARSVLGGWQTSVDQVAGKTAAAPRELVGRSGSLHRDGSRRKARRDGGPLVSFRDRRASASSRGSDSHRKQIGLRRPGLDRQPWRKPRPFRPEKGDGPALSSDMVIRCLANQEAGKARAALLIWEADWKRSSGFLERALAKKSIQESGSSGRSSRISGGGS